MESNSSFSLLKYNKKILNHDPPPGQQIKRKIIEPPLSSLFGIPVDIITDLFSYLSMSDSYSFSMTCKEMNRVYRFDHIIVNFERGIYTPERNKTIHVQKYNPMVKKSFLIMSTLEFLNNTLDSNIKFFIRQGLIAKIPYTKDFSNLKEYKKIFEAEYQAAYDALSNDKKTLNFSLEKWDTFVELTKYKMIEESNTGHIVVEKETFTLPQYFILSDNIYNVKSYFKTSSCFSYLLSEDYFSAEKIFNISKYEYYLLREMSNPILEKIAKLCKKNKIKINDFTLISLYILVMVARDKESKIDHIFSPPLINKVQFKHLFPGKNISDLPQLNFAKSPFRLVLNEFFTLREYLALADDILLILNDCKIYLLLIKRELTYRELLEIPLRGFPDRMTKTFLDTISNPYIQVHLELNQLSFKDCKVLNPLVLKILNCLEFSDNHSPMTNALYNKDEYSLNLCLQFIKQCRTIIKKDNLLYSSKFLECILNHSNARLRFLMSEEILLLLAKPYQDLYVEFFYPLIFSPVSEVAYFALNIKSMEKIHKLINNTKPATSINRVFIPNSFPHESRLALKNSKVQDAIFDQLLSLEELKEYAPLINKINEEDFNFTEFKIRMSAEMAAYYFAPKALFAARGSIVPSG